MFVVEIKLGCAHTECVDVYGAMPVAVLQVAVVQGLEERPALVEEVFNLLPLSLGVGFWGVVMCRGRFCSAKYLARSNSRTG